MYVSILVYFIIIADFIASNENVMLILYNILYCSYIFVKKHTFINVDFINRNCLEFDFHCLKMLFYAFVRSGIKF